MKINQIETPALILDEKLFNENLEIMDELIKETKIALRPHYKTHKCPQIARIQMQRGAKGITCSKLGELEDLVDAGFKDILLANQVVQPAKVARIAYLANLCKLTVCADDAENVKALDAAAKLAGSTVYCFVEYEVGMKRCGARTFEEYYDLVKTIQGCGNLVYEGIQAYAGNLAHEADFEKRKAAAQSVEDTLIKLKAYLEEKGVQVKEVSGISTGTAGLKKAGSIYTELQAGSYIFMDAAYKALNLNFKNALHILSTVISVKGDIVISDTGVKSCGVEQGPPIIAELPEGANILGLSEEHTKIECPKNPFKNNDKLNYIPGHCCSTVNLFDKMYVVNDQEVVDVFRIISRGKAI